MSREIKFRAWNHKAKEMYYEVDILSTGHASKDGHYLTYSNGKDVIMQFTGQKDKDGKDIYEGDILGVKHTEDPEKAGVVEVVWQYTGWFVHGEAISGDKSGHMFGPLPIDSEGAAVIGNVHENPDLIPLSDK